MGQKRFVPTLGFTGLSLVVLLAACGGEPEDVVGSTSAIEAANALTANALTANALTANALTANALTANALTANALTANGLRDPLARQFLKYVVSCALPADQSLTVAVDGQTYSFAGQLGLAPQWGGSDGSCDRSCQRWVSACVLARVDFTGVERMISIRGEHPALRASALELRQYPVREATYYGNLFDRTPSRYLCLSPGMTSVTRVCGPSLGDCPMSVMGSCSGVCDRPGRQGSFTECATTASGWSEISETVTVFLPR